jgi:hypothetical protein
MSLKKPYVIKPEGFDNEITAGNAIWRIDGLVGNKTRMSMNLGVYKDANMVQKLGQRTYDFEVSVQNGAKNFIAQGYDYLKTLPEFAGAQDC